MNNLEIINKIKREDLDEKNYFKAIIEAGYENEMLSDDDLINLQIGIIGLLDEKVLRYTGSESSSIRKEVMENINESNYYTIGLQLKTFKNPDDAIEEIKEKGLKKIYYDGRKRIDRMLDVIRVMYAKVKSNKLQTKNHIYNDTILGGIQGFLKIYDPDFNAQDMKITADYPLYNNIVGKFEGVEFISGYVNSIYLENKFCNMFENEKIERLLCSYSSKYEDLIINIFEIVFLEVIACKLVRRNALDLEISKSELSKIYELFKGKNKEEIAIEIIKVCNNIYDELIPEKENLKEYIKKNIGNIIDIIVNGIKQNTLDKVFIIQKFVEE